MFRENLLPCLIITLFMMMEDFCVLPYRTCAVPL